jgi:hypothetical protein
VMAADPPVKSPTEALDKEWLKEDIACALRLSALTAADRLQFAKAMTRLPATLDLQERGEITVHHSRHLAETVMTLDDDTATAVETSVLPKAPEQVLANFKRSVRKAVLKVAPKPAEERHEQAVTQRRVVRTPVADGPTMRDWRKAPAWPVDSRAGHTRRRDLRPARAAPRPRERPG